MTAPTAVQRRAGTAAEHVSFVGLPAELTVDETDNRVVVHDGATPGGHPMAKESEIAGFAPIADPTFTGVPAGPTAAPGTNTTQLATTAFVKAAVDAVVDTAPGALDTLNELAAALGDDANFAGTVTTSLAAKAPLASPAFTGNPVVPTQATSDTSTKIASTAFVKAAIIDAGGSDVADLTANVDFLSVVVSDLYGNYLGMARGWSDAFDTQDGIDTSASTNESYNAAGDYYEPEPSPITISVEGRATNTTTSTTHSMGTLSIGTAAADRDVIITGVTRLSSSGTLSGVTVGGVSATLDRNPTGTNIAWIARLRVTSGTSAAIVVNSANSMTQTAVQVYRMIGGDGNAPTTDGSASTSASVTLTQNVPAGGAVFGCQIEDSLNVTGLGFTAGVTEDFEYDIAGGNFIRGSFGSLTTASALTSQAFTATRAGSRGSPTNYFSIAIYSSGVSANMDLVSNAFAAPANVGLTAAFLDLEFGSALTAGTDFDFAMTSAGTPSYTSTGATYSLWYSSGNTKRYLVEGIDLSAQADDAVRARFRTLTNKAIKITGWRPRWEDA